MLRKGIKGKQQKNKKMNGRVYITGDICLCGQKPHIHGIANNSQKDNAKCDYYAK